jgi:hypothetical protein
LFSLIVTNGKKTSGEQERILKDACSVMMSRLCSKGKKKHKPEGHPRPELGTSGLKWRSLTAMLSFLIQMIQQLSLYSEFAQVLVTI